MELNKALPPLIENLLKQNTSEVPLYAYDCDLDLKGNFADCFWIIATKSALFIIENENLTKYNYKDYKTFKNLNQVDCGILVFEDENGLKIVAKYSAKHLSRFAYIARGVQLLIEESEKRIVSTEAEKICPNCNRPLPGTSKCPKCDKENRNLKRFLSLCKPYKWTFVVVVILMLVGSFAQLATQFVVRYFIDNHLVPETGTWNDVFVLFLQLGFFYGLELVLYLVRVYICNVLGTKITMDLRAKIYNKLQELSLSFITKRDPGAIMHRVTGDTRRINEFMSGDFCNVFGTLITFVSLIVLMLVMNWKLALANIVFIPIIAITVRVFWHHIHLIFRNQWKKYDEINNKLQDILSGIRVVKTFGKEKEECEKFTKLNNDHAKINSKNEIFFAKFYPLLSFLVALGSYVIIYLGGGSVLRGDMSVGELVQFMSYSSLLLVPVGWMSFLPRRIVQTTTSIERIYDILDEQPDIKQAPTAKAKEIIGHVKIENVTFGYQNYEPVLENINLDVKPGEMIGLVGSSGSGKSTLINLILRLYDVDDGSIKIDGTDIRDLDTGALHNQIGVVLQETFLFSGTILNNIRFSKPDATMAEIIYAAKQANAHEFICNLPDGYNTYVGEKGHNLSGGEKQRVAIARALLNNPKILILDEATSALDTESEYQIQEALERLRKGRTTFAIAHRLSTLRNADRIVVINDHKAAEIGNHDELLRQKGIYYSLVMAQLQMSSTNNN